MVASDLEKQTRKKSRAFLDSQFITGQRHYIFIQIFQMNVVLNDKALLNILGQFLFMVWDLNCASSRLNCSHPAILVFVHYAYKALCCLHVHLEKVPPPLLQVPTQFYHLRLGNCLVAWVPCKLYSRGIVSQIYYKFVKFTSLKIIYEYNGDVEIRGTYTSCLFQRGTIQSEDGCFILWK